MVGREAEVAPQPAGLLLAQRRRTSDQAAERVVREAHADQEADHGERVGEDQRKVVFLRVDADVFVVRRRRQRLADVPAGDVADDRTDDAREDVEADEFAAGRGASTRGGVWWGVSDAQVPRFSFLLRSPRGGRRTSAGTSAHTAAGIGQARRVPDVLLRGSSVANCSCVTTLPKPYIAPCQMPQSSVQRIRSSSGVRGSANAMLLTCGFASALMPSSLTVQEWIDVERGDVEFDHLVHGELDAVRLDAAVFRPAVGPLPLLADDLDFEPHVGGPVQRARLLSPCRRRSFWISATEP